MVPLQLHRAERFPVSLLQHLNSQLVENAEVDVDIFLLSTCGNICRVLGKRKHQPRREGFSIKVTLLQPP